MTHGPKLAVRNRHTALLVLAGMFAVHALALGLALYWAVEAGHPHDSLLALDPPAKGPVRALAQRPAAAGLPDHERPPPPAAAAALWRAADTPVPDWLSRTRHKDRPAPWHHDAPSRPLGASLP